MRRFLLVGLVLACCTLLRAAEEGARSDETLAAALKASGTIEADGKPLAEGKVTFYSSDGQFIGSKVKEGRFEIDHAWVGNFRIAIEGKGVPAKYGSVEKSSLMMTLNVSTNCIAISLQPN